MCTDRDSTTPFYLTISGLLASGGTGTATTSIHIATQALHASCRRIVSRDYLIQDRSGLLSRDSRDPNADIHPQKISLTGLPMRGQAVLCSCSPDTI